MKAKQAIAAGSIVLLLSTGVAFATQGSGATSTPLSAGTFTRRVEVDQQANADVQVVDVSFAPGGYTGWHSHPGAEVITVKAGAVTFKRVRDGECRVKTYSAGQGFAAYPRLATTVGPPNPVPGALAPRARFGRSISDPIRRLIEGSTAELTPR